MFSALSNALYERTTIIAPRNYSAWDCVTSMYRSRDWYDPSCYRYEIVEELRMRWVNALVLATFIYAVIYYSVVYARKVYLWYYDVGVIGHEFISKYVALLVSLVRQPKMQCNTIRSLFMSCPAVVNYPAGNHTHPNSAKTRNDGASFMDAFTRRIGRRGYFVQQSAADIRKGRVGCRSYHWAKDLNAPQSSFCPQPDDVLCIVDVDMYLDMNYLLTNSFHTVLLNTFQPSVVAKSDGEYSFTFDEENCVTYTVSGGAVYKHPVWNYGIDVLMATSWNWWSCMFTHHIYNVDRRRLDDHHQLVLLTPMKRMKSPLISLGRWLGTPVLDRLKVCVKLEGECFLRLNISTKDGMKRSTGRPGTYLQALVSASDDDALAALARVGKTHELTPATVKTVLKDVDQMTATILTEYHRVKLGATIDYVYPVADSVFKYQHDPPSYQMEKSSLTPFMSPLMLGCYAPDKCKSNDEAAIRGRLLNVKPDPDLVITPKLLQHMDSFLAKLIPDEGIGHPVDFEEVRDKQGKPTQRLILDRAGLVAALTCDSHIQSFQKAEAYEKPTDPRFISTIPGVNKYNYSRYTYAFTHILRATRWYAFGKKPKEIAQRVVEICDNARIVMLTDLSRFDGRVSKILRMLEHMAMLRYFSPRYRAELNELLASQKNQRAITTYGVRYETGESRLSGSPETADFNSLDNAFMAFVALSEDGYDTDFAWRQLGIYGGDDGITPDVDSATYVRACASVGQVLEIDEVKRGETGVKFLAREYGPEVWHGAMDSMCDVKRQLSKLHTTVSLPPNITPMQKLSEKLYSYYLSDANTPIIGDMARVLVEHFKEYVPEKLGTLPGVGYYHSVGCELDQQYPNSDSASGWMMECVKKQLPFFDFEKFDGWLGTLKRLPEVATFLKPPLCDKLEVTHVVKETLVINGNVVTPAVTAIEKPKVPYAQADLEKMAKLPCHQYAKGSCSYGAKCRYSHKSVVPQA